MKLTKYGHACVILESNGNKLIIDAGGFTELPTGINGVVAVVYTHMHGDHVSPENLHKIVAASPDATVYINPETLDVIKDVACNKIAVDADTQVRVADFDLSLYFIDHATIWQSAPCKNLAVKVGDFFYYPGDTFHVIPDHVQVVGVPVSAPWLKLSEAIQFVHDVNCDKIFPTHNGILNDAGHGAHNWGLGNFTKESGKELILLQNGESISDKTA
jgi:L-ascorbate metabolism protein UlaG (beta-lactamase superfamily)